MKCPECQTENLETRKFCRECGTKLLIICPQCEFENLPEDKFCGECGYRLGEVPKSEKPVAEAEGERKHVTVLFSDLSGYTAMSEKLDPEEVKEITSRIFSESAKAIAKYEGFVEKFVGDAVMALFGVPKSHEDDPIRAIRSAREIHDLVRRMNPELEEKIGQPLSMHTGINTGLVVTGELDLEKGTHGVSGDTINLASRLSSLAGAGEILAGQETYRQAEGYFSFEEIEPIRVKGRMEPIQVYRFLSVKEKPVTIHRLSGLRADLVGRKAELSQLHEAVNNLRNGKGRIFSICGDAGTGKSRLVEEFKATLDLQDIQWLEGHAYAYSQNIPYYPLVDLLNRVFQIEDGDPHEKVKEKVESGLKNLVGKKGDVVPYVGGLYSLSYPEVEDVSPEFWKSRLLDATLNIISALAQKAPTIFFLEDLHWADPSFVELLRHTLLQVRQPAIVLCVYRPVFSLFTSQQLSGVGKFYQEIRLQDLSLSEAQDMLESLLKTETIPSDLKRFVQDKAEGNPFYLEELVNSLIESETLLRDNGNWNITRPITETDISSTIHGLISGRLDRLEKETKRILQEASVIGRAFLYEILRRITELEERIDRSLSTLERLDLIRARSLQPDLEYMFKHPLTQEVVYNGLLKSERQAIHEQIALVMEQLFQDRLSEFYETLAFHFKQGRSVHKAIDYLMKSGEKSLRRCAVEEAHQYYKEAYEILTNKSDKSKDEEALIIDLLIKWSLVFYYRGDSKEQVSLLSAYEELARTLDDRARLGMFYAWYGFSLQFRDRDEDSYKYLHKALQLGEEIGDEHLIGYTCTWLVWTCAELGLLDEAIGFGERAQEIANHFMSDHYLYFKSLGGIGYTYFHKGDRKRTAEIGNAILDYGERHSNIRSMVMGYFVIGLSHLLNGNFPSAIEASNRAVQTAADPFYSQFPRFLLGTSYAQNGQYQEAEDALQEVVSFSRDFGCELLGTPSHAILGLLLIAKGQMSRGLSMVEQTLRATIESKRRCWYSVLEHGLGKVYLQIVNKSAPVTLGTLAKNIGFILKHVPSAGTKAEEHFKKAIQVSKEIGAKRILGQAHLDLGLLHKAKGRTEQARECITESIQIFEQCEAEVRLKEAKEALASLES